MLMLLLVIFGVSDSFNLLRWDILMVTALLAYLSISSKRYYFATFFILFGILFNPINTPSLSKTQWIWADIFLILLLGYWLFDYFASYHKGLLFEKFIINTKFPKNDWDLVDYTKDLHKKINRFIESDSNPDLIFRKRLNNNIIAVECKYRSNYGNHKNWGQGIFWNQKQGERYRKYSIEKNTPVYVSIGVGGNPRSPSTTSFIPLDIIQNKYYNFIPKNILETYLEIPKI